jgi:hypothetical protein
MNHQEFLINGIRFNKAPSKLVLLTPFISLRVILSSVNVLETLGQLLQDFRVVETNSFLIVEMPLETWRLQVLCGFKAAAIRGYFYIGV